MILHNLNAAVTSFDELYEKICNGTPVVVAGARGGHSHSQVIACAQLLKKRGKEVIALVNASVAAAEVLVEALPPKEEIR